MKKFTFAVVFILALFALLSCKDNNNTSANQNSIVEEKSTISTEEAASSSEDLENFDIWGTYINFQGQEMIIGPRTVRICKTEPKYN